MPRGKCNIRCKVCGKLAIGSGGATTCDNCLAEGYKYCPKCDEIKTVDDFYINNRGKPRSWCRQCEIDYTADMETTRRKIDEEYRLERNAQKSAAKRLRYATDEEFRLAEIQKQYRRQHVLSIRGKFTADEWIETLEAFDYSCAYCGSKHNLTIDHVVALKQGGYNYIFNIVPSCFTCNASKGAKDVVEWYSAQDFYDEDKLRSIHKRYRVLQDKLLKELKEKREAEGGEPACPK